WGVCLTVPNLTEHGRAQGLAGDHDISLAIFVPETGTTVNQNGVSGIGVLQPKRRFFTFEFTRRNQFILFTPRQSRSARFPGPDEFSIRPSLQLCLVLGISRSLFEASEPFIRFQIEI